jgi:hypothetical protein
MYETWKQVESAGASIGDRYVFSRSGNALLISARICFLINAPSMLSKQTLSA